jgi:hypothetical protein
MKAENQKKIFENFDKSEAEAVAVFEKAIINIRKEYKRLRNFILDTIVDEEKPEEKK